MSDSPDDQTGQGQGGNQHGGQPQGGQPQGQPQAQPHGQPQGQYQGGRPTQGGYNTGPGMGDIFSIPETKNEMKIGVLLSVLLSVGLAFGALGLTTMSTGIGGIGAGFGSIGISGAIVLAPVLGLFLGVRQADVLEDQPGNIPLGNAAVTAFIGSFVFLLLSLLLGLIISGSTGSLGNVLGQMILPYLITAIGAAVVAAGSAWAVRNVRPGPSRAQAPQQQGQPR